MAFILYIYLFLRSEQNLLAVSYKEEMRKQEVRCVTEDYCPANSANVLIFRRREVQRNARLTDAVMWSVQSYAPR